jgi:phosphate:Na+ symporter
MQIAWFHVIFNVTTTLILLPFVKYLVKFAELVIKDKKSFEDDLKLKYVDDLLLKTLPIAIMQTKKELEYMIDLARENIKLSQKALFTGDKNLAETISKNEKVINFTNKSLTRFLIKLSSLVASSEEKVIGTYFHVLNDVERIGDHAENFYQIGTELKQFGMKFSENASQDISNMYDVINEMFDTATVVFNEKATDKLQILTEKENIVDKLEKSANNNHVKRLSTGSCNTDTSAYFFSVIAGLERVADHLVNVGYSILNPTGSQNA